MALCFFQPHLLPQIQIGKYVQCGLSCHTSDKQAKERSCTQRGAEALKIYVVALLQELLDSFFYKYAIVIAYLVLNLSIDHNCIEDDTCGAVNLL